MNTEREDLARYYMWQDYGCYTKRMKNAYASQFNCLSHQMEPKMHHYQQADAAISKKSPPTTPPSGVWAVDIENVTWAALKRYNAAYGQMIVDDLMVNEETEEEKMEREQRDYLSRRLSNIECQKADEGRDFFKINPPAGPATVKEMKERLATGKFTVDGHDEYTLYDWSWSDCFSWRTEPADQDGFTAFYTLMQKDAQATKDQIKILPVEDGLKALQDFESKTYH